LGASRFQVKPLIEAGRGEMCIERLGRDELLNVINDFSKQFCQMSTALEFLCVPPENTFSLPAKACGSVNKIYISNTGQVSACNYLSDGIMGDLSSRSLEDILNFRSLVTKIDLINGSRVLAGCPQYKRY
jgi:MoaA/NifB/PqqE/SkfB family radical SAM enzyme